MKSLAISILTLCCFTALSQVEKDLDKDGKPDKVWFDQEKAQIVCELSTQNFKPMRSREMETDGQSAYVKATKNGFEFRVSYMRAGYACQFRYDENSKRVQLIGMSRYEFGNAANDGSGKSSVNLLNGDYLGEWNVFSERKQKLEKLPDIRTKMLFVKTFLEDFDESLPSSFTDRCSELFYAEKTKHK